MKNLACITPPAILPIGIFAMKIFSIPSSSHPRGNKEFPEVGIFSQRRKARPNLLGTTIVKLIKAEKNVLTVSGLDAIDGTPVIDIKPVFKEFLPREKIIQPEWTSRLMEKYWG